jgi:hypothetical protein
MTRLKFLGAVAIVFAITGAPVFAQGAIQEPGAFAFYHPDAYAFMDGNANSSSCAERYRSFDPASGTYLGYDGNRHPCQ